MPGQVILVSPIASTFPPYYEDELEQNLTTTSIAKHDPQNSTSPTFKPLIALHKSPLRVNIYRTVYLQYVTSVLLMIVLSAVRHAEIDFCEPSAMRRRSACTGAPTTVTAGRRQAV